MTKKSKKRPAKQSTRTKVTGRSSIKKKNGRPSKYRQEFEEQAYKLCLLGATDAEMADFFGVQEKTINNWKKTRKGFLQSIKRGKAAADADVAESLYKRACGYEHPETKVFCSDGFIITHEVTKYWPPDTGACMAWLKNRTRKLTEPWSDKQEVVHDVAGTLAEALHKAKSK